MLYTGDIIFADSIADAADQLSADPAMAILAGATWLMRAELRHELHPKRYLALSRIAALRAFKMGDKELSIGSMATHTQIAAALKDRVDLRGLKHAARNSANPGVRRLATLGGNICAEGFAAADLVTVLLALHAEVEIIENGEIKRLPLAEFRAQRSDNPSTLLTRVFIAREQGTSAHARLTMRAAGDYPIAIASVWMSDDSQNLRIAIGAVEASPRRWIELEQALIGASPDPAQAEQMAKAHLHTISGRNAVDAKGAYRLRVLPSLIGRAMADLKAERRAIA